MSAGLPSQKRSVDGDRRAGRFLLTGFANLLLLPRVAESLAGRMEVIRLQPFTESEKERVPGLFLRDFLEGRLEPKIVGDQYDTPPTLPARLVAGGYPEPLTRSQPRARQWHRQYLRAIIERDIKDVAQIRDGEHLARLLELLALRTATLLNVSGPARDLGLYRRTVADYVVLLGRLFLVRRLPAWHRNQARRLIKTPKIHVVDSGLGATLADIEQNDWLERRELIRSLAACVTRPSSSGKSRTLSLQARPSPIASIPSLPQSCGINSVPVFSHSGTPVSRPDPIHLDGPAQSPCSPRLRPPSMT